MKKYSLLFLAMMGVFSLTWTGCTDEVTYVPAETVEGQGVFFPKSVQTSYTLKDVKGEITLNVGRTNTTGSFDAPLTVSINEGGEKLFNVPTSVPFAAGEDSTAITITFDNLVQGTNYEVALSFADATDYANSAIKLNVIYPKAKEYTWKVLSDQAVLIDNLIAKNLFGKADYSLAAELGKKIVVEKANEANLIRFKCPYDNAFYDAMFGEEVGFLPADYEMPYIVLNGEKYKKEGLWCMDPTCIGVKVSGDGNMLPDNEYQLIGSVAGYLSTADGPIPPTSSKFPLGKFDKKSKMFDFGSLFIKLANPDGGYMVANKAISLYLDPKLMEPDYDRDFKWFDVEKSNGQFTSEISGEVTFRPVQQAKEDPTFYRIPAVYSKVGNIYFNIKDGVVTMPKKQKTGLDTYGNPIFMEATPGKCAFNPETNLLTLGITFYMGDKKGNKIADLTSGIETFMWGYTEIDLLQKSKSIDDYVGTWNVPVGHVDDGPIGQFVPVSITKVGDKELAVKGLSFSGLDDTCIMEYDAATGLLSLGTQRVPDYQGIPMYVSPLQFATFDVGIINYPTDKFIIGLNDKNVLTFYNDPANNVRWDGLIYVLDGPNGLGILTAYYAILDWAKGIEQQTKTLTAAPAFAPIPTPSDSKTFKVSLYDSYEKQNNELKSFKFSAKPEMGLFK